MFARNYVIYNRSSITNTFHLNAAQTNSQFRLRIPLGTNIDQPSLNLNQATDFVRAIKSKQEVKADIICVISSFSRHSKLLGT